MPQMLQAVIFDLDGVLCDTSRCHGQAWAALARSLGCEPPADLEEQVRGISRLASLKIALGSHASRYGQAELEALADRKNDEYRKAIAGVTPADLFPGVLDLFADLRRADIKIALGSASRNAKTVLALLGIADAFDAIADGYSYTHGKPHPDVFLTAARMAGVSPAGSLVVEDAAAGIDAALAGGFVAVGMGRYDSLKHAHAFVTSLRELNAQRLIDLHARVRAGAA